jgi:hypothetical protein
MQGILVVMNLEGCMYMKGLCDVFKHSGKGRDFCNV